MNVFPQPPDMDKALLAQLIKHCYHVQIISLQRLPSDSGKHIYQLQLAQGVRWILRVVKEPNKTVLVELTNLLMQLEHQQYPAERIIPTAEKTALGSRDDWHMLMSTYIVGRALDHSSVTLGMLGASIGQLHALKLSQNYVPPMASMLPANEIAYAQQQLAAIIPLVPKQYMVHYDILERALSAIDCGTQLPTTLIHNDCHPANARLSVSGHATLLDWEGAGMGPAVLDLGFLLANCDGKTPWEECTSFFYKPDSKTLQGVLKNYSQHHQLSAAEIDYLPDAIRFRALIFGACHFAVAIARHAHADFSQWWWQRYNLAEEIAQQARIHLEHVA